MGPKQIEIFWNLCDNFVGHFIRKTKLEDEIEKDSTVMIKSKSTAKGQPKELNENKSLKTWMNLNEIVIDDDYRGRVRDIPELVDEYEQAYLTRQEVPYITLEKPSRKLIDGHHRYLACLRIKERFERKELTKKETRHLKIGSIQYRYVNIPVDVEPCVYSLGLNLKNGRRASQDDIKAGVIAQLTRKPGYPVNKLSTMLGISENTVRTHGKELIKKWKKERNQLIRTLNKEGLKQEEIGLKLKTKWPWSTGTSQSNISEILSETLRVRKTGKNKAEKVDLNKNDPEPKRSTFPVDVTMNSSETPSQEDRPAPTTVSLQSSTSAENDKGKDVTVDKTVDKNDPDVRRVLKAIGKLLKGLSDQENQLIEKLLVLLEGERDKTFSSLTALLDGYKGKV